MQKGWVRPSLKRNDDDADEQKVAARWMKRLKHGEVQAYQGSLQHPYFGASFVKVVVTRNSWTEVTPRSRNREDVAPTRHSYSLIVGACPKSPVQVVRHGKKIRIMDSETELQGEETSNGIFRGIVVQLGKPGGIFHLKVATEELEARPWRHVRGEPVSNNEIVADDPEAEPQETIVASKNSKVIIKLRPKAAPAKNELSQETTASNEQANDSVVAIPKKMPKARKTNQQEDPVMQSWANHCSSVQRFFTEHVGPRKHADQVLQILARHSARLAKDGIALEQCVRRAIAKLMANGEAVEAWEKLQSPGGEEALSALKKSANNAYSKGCRNEATDLMVREIFGMDELLGEEVLAIPMGDAVPTPPERPCLSEQKGELMLVPIIDLRFAHNDQSEHFARSDASKSILQLAVELVTGLTQVADIPTFTVCWHDNHWYCRSGNRRLAALVLAATFAPQRIHCVWVQKVPLDTSFLKGRPNGRPKLTTHLNDSDNRKCKGRWMILKETGEMIGHANVLAKPPYGADLLSLLCF